MRPCTMPTQSRYVVAGCAFAGSCVRGLWRGRCRNSMGKYLVWVPFDREFPVRQLDLSLAAAGVHPQDVCRLPP